jgi:hypothetical protein
MTWAMHAVGYLELNKGTKLDNEGSVASLFNQSFANVQQPWAVWTETPTGGATNFITGAGGFLQVGVCLDFVLLFFFFLIKNVTFISLLFVAHRVCSTASQASG